MPFNRIYLIQNRKIVQVFCEEHETRYSVNICFTLFCFDYCLVLGSMIVAYFNFVFEVFPKYNLESFSI